MVTIHNSPACSCYIDDARNELEVFTEAIKNPDIRTEIITILEEAGLLPL